MTQDVDLLAGAEAIHDLLTMLGVDPDERPEEGVENASIAETLAGAVLKARWRWIQSTVQLQNDFYRGIKLATGDSEAFADFMLLNGFAAVNELNEGMGEVGWKNWITNRGWVNREAFIREMVDLNHFVANMLGAVECTDDEYEAAYRDKQRVNKERMASKTYDGVTSKCPGCKRDLNEPGVDCEVISKELVRCITQGIISR